MRVAATDCNFVPLFCQRLCMCVGPFKHVAITSFNRGKIFTEPFEVFALALAGEAGEHMIDAEEKPAFAEIHQKRDKIAAALLKLRVLAFGDVVDADMNFSPARHAARQLLAEKEIRKVAPQLFRSFDRVVVGQSKEIHATATEQRIYFARIAVTFAAKFR